jgi:predicted nuclease with TOPRIM domain
MSFEQTIQEWVKTEQELQELNERIKQLRQTKSELDKKITHHSEERGTKSFRYGSIKMKIVESKISESLTFKYLDKCLRDMIKNEDQVNQMLDYIKRKRDVKTVSHVITF